MVVEEEPDALLLRAALQRAIDDRAASAARALGALSLLPDGVVLTGRGNADRVSPLHAGRPVLERDAVLEQELVGSRFMIGERPLHPAIVVAVLRHAVGLDHRPVGQILEQDLRRIDDAVLLLGARAAAERHLAAVDDAVAADVVVGFDDDDRRAVIGGANGGGQTARAGTDDDDVGFEIPRGRKGGPPARLRLHAQARHGGRAGERGGADPRPFDERPAADVPFSLSAIVHRRSHVQATRV